MTETEQLLIVVGDMEMERRRLPARIRTLEAELARYVRPTTTDQIPDVAEDLS
jgi:hypothetical protein